MGDQGPDCSSFTGAASLVLGAGTQQTGYVEIEDGDDMMGTLGPQGLYMVTPSIRAQQMYPGVEGRVRHDDDPMIMIEARIGGETVGGSARTRMGLTIADDGLERLGVWVPFDGDLTLYVNKMVLLRATVTDACDRSVMDTLLVRVRQ